MRSEQIHKAIAQGNTRFEICSLVSRGLKLTHKRGLRFEDSIGDVLGMLGRRPAEQRCSVEAMMAFQAVHAADVGFKP